MATTRIKSGAVEVHGLGELNRALKAMDSGLSRELRGTNKSVADFVASDAKSAAYSVGGVAAHVAPTIKASAGVTSAGVAFGGTNNPEAGGAEFGSNQYAQFQPWRGSGPGAGYFVYPTIRGDLDRIEDEYSDAVGDLIRRVGLA